MAAMDWISAGADIGTAVGTVGTAGVAVWLATSDRRRHDAERREARASQARLITAEVVWPSDDDELVGWFVTCVFITNYSQHPALSVRLRDIRCNNARATNWLIDGNVNYEPVDVLAPGKTYKVPFVFVDAEDVKLKHTELGPCTPIITFVDANGRRWQREGHAEPMPITD